MYQIPKKLKDELVNCLVNSTLPAKDAFYFIQELNKLPEIKSEINSEIKPEIKEEVKKPK